MKAAPWLLWALTTAALLLARSHGVAIVVALILGALVLVARHPRVVEWTLPARLAAPALGAGALLVALVSVPAPPLARGLAVASVVPWWIALDATMRLRAAQLQRVGAWSSAGARAGADAAMVMGAGLARPGPGTAGALAALALGPPLLALPPLMRAAVLVVGTALAIAATASYLRHAAVSRDPSEVVVDELIGTSIALAFVPSWSVVPVVIAFVAFRAFDIVKPWPVGAIDRRWKSPAGVVMDDVVAGLLAGAVVRAAGLVS